MKISGEKERGKEKRGGDDHPCLVPRVEIYGERGDNHPYLVSRVEIFWRKRKGRDDHPYVEIYKERGDNHPHLA